MLRMISRAKNQKIRPENGAATIATCSQQVYLCNRLRDMRSRVFMTAQKSGDKKG